MTAVGFLLIAGGLVAVYAGVTGENPVAALQGVLSGGKDAGKGKAPGKVADVIVTAPNGRKVPT